MLDQFLDRHRHPPFVDEGRTVTPGYTVKSQQPISCVAPEGFKPLPLRWRVEATFGTLANRYRRLTRNWEESPKNSEDAVEWANCHRLIRNYGRDILGQT